MAMLTDDDAPAILRGPMVTKYLQMFVRQVDWGDLDVLLLDLPPGTGDIQLTLAQAFSPVRCRGGQHAAGCQPQDRAARPSHDGAGQRAHSRRHREHERVHLSLLRHRHPHLPPGRRRGHRAGPGRRVSRQGAARPRTWSIAATRDGRSCAMRPTAPPRRPFAGSPRRWADGARIKAASRRPFAWTLSDGTGKARADAGGPRRAGRATCRARPRGGRADPALVRRR